MNARARRHAARAEARLDAKPLTTAALMRPSHKKTRGATKLTPTQRDSTGRPSDWNRGCEFFTDPKWSATARSNKAV